ncbi:MAG: hypothetical protein ACLQBD_20385 [Syntrophobacteraceae bacterium]
MTEDCASNAVSPEEKSNLSKVGKFRLIDKSRNAEIVKRRIFDRERIEGVVLICWGQPRHRKWICSRLMWKTGNSAQLFERSFKEIDVL